MIRGIFSVCAPPPSLVGAYYLQPPDARAKILHNDLLYDDTCSVIVGTKRTGGGGLGGGLKRKRFDYMVPMLLIPII